MECTFDSESFVCKLWFLVQPGNRFFVFVQLLADLVQFKLEFVDLIDKGVVWCSKWHCCFVEIFMC